MRFSTLTPALRAAWSISESGSPAGKQLVSLVDELGLDEIADQLDSELAVAPPGPETALEATLETAPETAPEATPAAPEAAPSPADPLDETGMSWLDDLEREESATESQDEAIFEEEDDFFDLAAELERELSEDDEQESKLVQPQDQSLEEIIEGFKRGVAENLSSEDYDTHFNLGIAYREMGLLDEAIGEFQLASKDERYVIDSSALLGLCFLDKGLPELAVRWYRKGLESPSIQEAATLGLLYDMGDAYVSLGDVSAAYKTFVEVYGIDSNYRDISAKLERFKAQS